MAQAKKYKVGIEITGTPEEVQRLGNLIQNAVSTVENKDITKLLSKVQKKPSIVKTALNFM